MMELELKELCERFVDILDELRVKDLITDEELRIHSEKKLKFLKTLNLQ